jgi:hypothetical protein
MDVYGATLERIEILKPLLLAYPRANMAQGNIKIYAEALTVLSAAELKAAVLRCISTLKFFPAISEIVEAAEVVANAARGITPLTAGEAWQMAMREVRRCCHVEPPQIENAAVAETARLFGWAELCCLQERDANTARAQFTKIYEGVLLRKRNRRINKNVLAVLAGGVAEKLSERQGGERRLRSV